MRHYDRHPQGRGPMQRPHSPQLAEPLVLRRPFWAAFVGPDPRKFERRLGVLLWIALFAVLFNLG